MKKVTYIANMRLPTEKAHGLQIMKTCEAFSLNGIDVELLVPWRFNRAKDDPFFYYGIRRKFKIRKIPSIDLVKLGRVGFLIQSASFAFFSSLYLFFKKTGAIYSRDELPLVFFSFFKKNIFWEAHTDRHNFIARMLLNRCKGVISITEGLKKFYVDRGADRNKIVVVPDGIDLDDFARDFDKTSVRKEIGLPIDKKIVLYIGRLDGWKGVETLLSSIKFLPSLIQVAIIGGEPEQVSYLKKKYPEAIFLGFLPYRDLPKNQKAGDILILPNTGKDEISAKFTSPLKLFAYMASGRPIVSSDLPSLREVLNENNACFFEADNAQSLASAIKNITDDKEKQDKISKQALRDIIKYTWDSRAKTIISFINGISLKDNR